jgi:hypothetical protein
MSVSPPNTDTGSGGAPFEITINDEGDDGVENQIKFENEEKSGATRHYGSLQ